MSRPLRRLIAQRRDWRFIRRQVAAACAADPKLYALLSRIATRARPDWRLRELLRVAFKSDFEAYRQLGQPITNCGWVKGEECPLPIVLALRGNRDGTPGPRKNRADGAGQRLEAPGGDR